MAKLKRGEEFFPLQDSAGDGSIAGMSSSGGKGAKFQSVKSYFKNVTKSAIGIAGEMADNYVPNLKDFATGITDTARAAAVKAGEARASLAERSQGGSVTKLIKQTAAEFGAAAKKAATTGQFHTQMDFGFGDDGDAFGDTGDEDLGSFDFSNDFGDFSGEDPFASGDTGTADDLGLGGPASGEVASGPTIVKETKQQSIRQYFGNDKVIMEGMGKVAKANAEVALAINQRQSIIDEQRFQEHVHYQKAIAESTGRMAMYFGQEAVALNAATMEYMAKSLALQQDTIALLKDVKASSESNRFDRFSEQNKESAMNQITGAGFDGNSYFDNIKNNVKSMFEGSMLGQVTGMAGMGKDMLSMDKRSMGEKIFSAAVGNLPSLFLSAKTKAKLGRLNRMFDNAGASMMMKFNSMSNFSDNPLLRSIGTAMGVQGFAQRKSNMGLKDPYAKVDFDAKSHMSLNEVIPGILSKIYSAVSGQEELFFDYKTGQFKKSSSIMKRFKMEEENAYNSDAEFATLRNKMARDSVNSDSKASGMDAAKLDSDFKAIAKNIVNTRMTFEPNRVNKDQAYTSRLLKGSDRWNYGPMALEIYVRRFLNMAGSDQIMFMDGIAGTLKNVDRFNAASNEEYQKFGGAQVVAGQFNQAQSEEYEDKMSSGLFDARRLQEKNPDGSFNPLYEKDPAARKQLRDRIMSAKAEQDRLTGGAVDILGESSNGTISGARSVESLVNAKGPVTQNTILQNIYDLLTDGIIVFPRDSSTISKDDHLVKAKYIKTAQAAKRRAYEQAENEKDAEYMNERQKMLMQQATDSMYLDYAANMGGFWSKMKDNPFDRGISKGADAIQHGMGRFLLGANYNKNSEEMSTQEEIGERAGELRKQAFQDIAAKTKAAREKGRKGGWVSRKLTSVADNYLDNSINEATEIVNEMKKTQAESRREEAFRWAEQKLIKILGRETYDKIVFENAKKGQKFTQDTMRQILLGVEKTRVWLDDVKEGVVDKSQKLKDASVDSAKKILGEANYNKLVAKGGSLYRDLVSTFGLRPGDTPSSYIDRVGKRALGDSRYDKIKGQVVDKWNDVSNAVVRDMYGKQHTDAELAGLMTNQQAAYESRKAENERMSAAAEDEGIRSVMSNVSSGSTVGRTRSVYKNGRRRTVRSGSEGTVSYRAPTASGRVDLSSIDKMTDKLDMFIRQNDNQKVVETLDSILQETRKLTRNLDPNETETADPMAKMLEQVLWLREQMEKGQGIPVHAKSISEAVKESLSQVLASSKLLDPNTKEGRVVYKKMYAQKKGGFWGTIFRGTGKVLSSPFALAGGVLGGAAALGGGVAEGVGGALGNAGRSIDNLFSGGRDPFQVLRGDIDKPSMGFGDLFVRAKDLFGTGKINKTEFMFFIQEAFVGKGMAKETLVPYLKGLETDKILGTKEYRRLYEDLMLKGDITIGLTKPKSFNKPRKAFFGPGEKADGKKTKGSVVKGTLKFFGDLGGGTIGGAGALLGGLFGGAGKAVGGILDGAGSILKKIFTGRKNRLYGTPLQILRGDIDKPSMKFEELVLRAQDLYATNQISKVELMFFIQEVYMAKDTPKKDVVAILQRLKTDKSLSDTEYRRLYEEFMQKGSLVLNLEKPKSFKMERKADGVLKKRGMIGGSLQFIKKLATGGFKLGTGTLGWAWDKTKTITKSSFAFAKKVFGKTPLQKLRKEVSKGQHSFTEAIETIKTMYTAGDVGKDEVLYFMQEFVTIRKLDPKVMMDKLQELKNQGIITAGELKDALKNLKDHGTITHDIPVPKTFKPKVGILNKIKDGIFATGRGVKGGVTGIFTGAKKAWDRNKEDGGGFLKGSIKALAGAIGGSVKGAVAGIANKKDPNDIREGSMIDAIRDRKEAKKEDLMKRLADDVHAIRMGGVGDGKKKKEKDAKTADGGLGLPGVMGGGALGKFFGKLLGLAGIAAVGYGAYKLVENLGKKNEIAKAYDEGNVSMGEKLMLHAGGENGRYDALGNRIEDQGAYQASLLKPQAIMAATAAARFAGSKGAPAGTDRIKYATNKEYRTQIKNAKAAGIKDIASVNLQEYGSKSGFKVGGTVDPKGMSGTSTKGPQRGPDGRFNSAKGSIGAKVPGGKQSMLFKAKDKIAETKAKVQEKTGSALEKIKKFFGDLFGKSPFNKFIKPEAGKKAMEAITKFLAKNAAAQLAKGVLSAVLKAATPIGWAMIAYDFIAGMAEANRHFRLGAGAQPNIMMRVTAGLVNMLSNLLFGLIPVEWAVTNLYNIFAQFGPGKEFLAESKAFNEERGKLLGVEGDRLVEFESRPWTEQVFGGDNRAAKTLGFKDVETFKAWQDSKYKPLKDIFDNMKNQYGGDAILEPAATPEDSTRQKEFKKAYLREAEGYLSTNAPDPTITNPSDKTTIAASADNGFGGTLAGLGAGAAAMGAMGPGGDVKGSASPSGTSSALTGAGSAASVVTKASMPVAAAAIGAGAAGAGVAAATVKGTLTESPLQTKVKAHSKEVESQYDFAEDLLKESKRHNDFSEGFMTRMELLVGKVLKALVTPAIANLSQAEREQLFQDAKSGGYSNSMTSFVEKQRAFNAGRGTS